MEVRDEIQDAVQKGSKKGPCREPDVTPRPIRLADPRLTGAGVGGSRLNPAGLGGRRKQDILVAGGHGQLIVFEHAHTVAVCTVALCASDRAHTGQRVKHVSPRRA